MNKLLLVGFAWTTFLTSGLQHPASSQHQHTAPRTPLQAGEAQAAHHSFLDQERAAIERGEGFGMAMVADRNGYPGPKHVLELTAELQLTPEQQTAMEKLFAQMKAQALARGKELLLAEAQLDQMFAEGRPEAELQQQTNRVASLRGELRWVHLSAHLAARKLLTPQQLATYQHFRYAAHSVAPAFGAIE